MFRREGNRHLSKGDCGGRPEKRIGRYVLRDDCPSLDHGPVSDVYIGKDQAVRPDEDVLADHHLAVPPLPPLSPVEMGEDRGPKPDGAILTDRNPLRVQFVDVYKLADPDSLTDLGAPDLVKPGAEGVATRNDECNFM